MGSPGHPETEVQPLCPTPCSPGASELSHRESTSLAEHTGRRVKGAGDTFKREELLVSVPRVSSPQALGERKVHVEGGAMEDSQQRREVVSVSNLGS